MRWELKSPTRCPLCGVESTQFRIETKNVFGNLEGGSERAFYECHNCTVFFQWPTLTKEEELIFYNQEFEKFMATRSPSGDIDWTKPSSHRRTNEPQRRRRERYLSSHYSRLSELSEPSLLEVGCSSGFMLTGLQQRYGIHCTGIEPSDVFRGLLKTQGFDVYSSLEELRRLKPDHRYDLITHYFVLEHIQDPARFLIEQFELLKSGGQIIIEIPNAADPLRTIFPTEAFEKFYWSIAHPWYFTEKSVNHLLEKICQFKDFEISLDQRYDIGNHTRWLLEGKPGGQGRLESIFDETFNECYRKSLVQSGLADTLILTIRKNT